MNLLSRSTDYAIRALIYMAGDEDRTISTADLDRDLGLPRPFMRKTLQALQRSGYLSSVKGNKGGFRLETAPEKVRLIDLMTIFQGPISLGDCLFKKKLCSCVRTCPLRREIKSMERDVLDRLKSVTLAGLMKEQG
jgi:Rrf2 family transcriptional regulator, cysteine metabolism repressor